MKKLILKIICFAAALITAAQLCAPAFYAEDVDLSPLTAKSALILNLENGAVLYGQNEKTPVFCGFLARTMISVLALESNIDKNTEIVITKEMLTAAVQPGYIGFKEGRTVSLSDAIAACVVGNSLEAAAVIALTLYTDMSECVAAMNEKAKALGALNTVFTNATGYYSSAAETTATDIAAITKYALSVGNFAILADTSYMTIKVNGRNFSIYSRNNVIVPASPYYMRKAEGVGVSASTDGGSATADYVKYNDMRILCVAITDGAAGDAFSDIKLLLNFALNEYAYRLITEEGSSVGEVSVKYGKDRDTVVVVCDGSVALTVPKSVPDNDIIKIVELPAELTAPVKKGDILGTMTLEYDGMVYGTVNLIAKTSVNRDMMAYYTEKINGIFGSAVLWGIIFTVVILIGAYAFATYYVNRNRRRKRELESRERVKLNID